ncbi:MAG: hypothetical protein COV29_00890 [Candidatus Yanofskybacteria bacterium CG10_big_fil_rev_8_21_14_0_10_36_16]|uniref:Uncharacterized protein n=1 Tax=Candidatus Yanofskybacteria bacterium CG10_big_fil_rev_8_21_14_0_10_36_16 TaxID=1975096 RepID=A0A2J0Q821_9BACT|nr:MAG: hypothetical protein COV29_00890 [Candidatus Yanofskybacteria bacterium CG10_big_fil_rev_8_21_14_0_10_36_16]
MLRKIQRFFEKIIINYYSDKIWSIPIYHDGDQFPNLEDLEEMEGVAIDAYNYMRGTDRLGAGDFSDDSKILAVRTVAYQLGISIRKVINQCEICILPWAGFHGKIMARMKA